MSGIQQSRLLDSPENADMSTFMVAGGVNVPVLMRNTCKRANKGVDSHLAKLAMTGIVVSTSSGRHPK